MGKRRRGAAAGAGGGAPFTDDTGKVVAGYKDYRFYGTQSYWEER